MNMISTGAFQTEMDASNKQSTLAKKFAAVWEKKNAKAARAGGVSLMALSLAACGSDDATTTVTTTPATTTTTTPVTPAVDAAKAITLTTGTDTGASFTGGSGDDTFTATHLTYGAIDELAGGTGADTLTIVNTGAANYTAAAAKVSAIEAINITSQHATSAATKEVTTVTFQDIASGQSIIFDGETFTAGGSGATAEQIATSFTSGTAVGGAFTGSFALATTAASTGSSGDKVDFTASTAGNATNLTVTGSSQSAEQSAQTLTFATKPGNTNNTVSVTVNGTTITSIAAGGTTAAKLTLMVADLTGKINMMAGINATKTDSGDTIMLMSNKDVDVTGYATAGTSNTTTLTTAYGITAGTYTFATNPGATSGFSVDVNGTNVALGTNINTVASITDLVAAKINTVVAGAASSDGTSVLTIASDIGIVLGFDDIGSTGNTPASQVFSDGYHAASPASAVYVDGAAAVTAAAYSTTVDASKFTGATSMASVNSTADVSFTNMVSTQTGIVSGNTAITNGATTFGHKATATSFDIDIKDGTTAGNVTATGAAGTSASISSSGVKNTVGTIDVAAAKTITVDAAVNLTATAIATTGTLGSLTITGAGAASIGTLDGGLDTVDASGNSGGLTALIGTETDTVLTGSSGADKITASSTDAIANTAKLAVNAGAGSDTLVVGDAADINTAEDGARYTGFEVLSLSDTQDASLVAGITSLSMAAASSKSITGVSAVQADAITVTGDQGTAFTVTLNNATGTADSVTLDLKSTTATTNVDVAALSVVGVETLNVIGSTGTAATDSDLTFAASGANALKTVNMSGTADMTISGANTSLAMTVNATTSGAVTATGAFIAASTINTGDGADAVTLSTNNGSTYNTGGGKDTITAAVARLVATGSADHVVNGGDAVDTLAISDTAATVIDNHFTNVSNVEKITTSTGSTSITAGAAFNTAFADGVTITSGTLADTSSYSYVGGLYAKDTTITIDGSSLVADAGGEDITVTTGGGNDTVTTGTDTTWAGKTSGDGGSFVISTGAGNDSITFAYGTLTSQATSQAGTITAGTGVDTITKTTGINGTTASSVIDFVFANGDSVVGAYDTIVGYDTVTNSGSLFGDILDLTAATVGTSVGSTDSGTILSHSLSGGKLSFDDAATYAAALVINAGNLSDVTSYLDTNLGANTTVIFEYDRDSNGTAESTMVFTNISNATGTGDTLIMLQDVIGAGLSATATLTTDEFIIIG
jgi:hypothetical protein